MMEPSHVRDILSRAFPEAEITVEDLTGGKDHFRIVVLSELFRGKSLIDQHRLVQSPLQAMLNDGRIHAVQIKTLTSPVHAGEKKDSGNLGRRNKHGG